ncbi:hypothetical protein [Brevibacillus sp. SYSU BS000544]|uniref:hypothetical protein n=1 Tax=Brevibacillus sp. SYSU BS000544 TaxID=3416443 RepID=UPI003CE5596F
MTLKRFDLLFIKGKTPISRIIKKITRSPYSHVAIFLYENHIAETDWQVPLQVRHLPYRPAQYDVYRYHKDFSPEQIEKMNTFLQEHLMAEYDTWQSITNGIHLLTGLPIMNAPDRLNCSETAARMLSTAGIDVPPGITPGELSQLPILKRIA